MRKYLFVLLVLLCPPAYARSTYGCVEECSEEYEDDIESCVHLWDDPDDTSMLISCINSAESDYDSCKTSCELLDEDEE